MLFLLSLLAVVLVIGGIVYLVRGEWLVGLALIVVSSPFAFRRAWGRVWRAETRWQT